MNDAVKREKSKTRFLISEREHIRRRQTGPSSSISASRPPRFIALMRSRANGYNILFFSFFIRSVVQFMI